MQMGMYIYVILTGILYVILWLVSSKIPCQGKLSKLELTFYKMALWILNLPGAKRIYSLSVEKDLQLLYPLQEKMTLRRHYYAKKIAEILEIYLLMVVASFLIFQITLPEEILEDGNAIARGDYGQQEKEIKLRILAKDTLELPFSIKSRRYSKKQIENMAEDCFTKLSREMLLDNANSNHVVSDLYLPDKLPEYPFSMEWSSNHYGLVDSDGTVHNEELVQSEIVTLTAVITYEPYEFLQDFPIEVYPKEYTKQEKWQQQVESALKNADENQRDEEKLNFPMTIANQDVRYEILEPKDAPKYIVFCVLLAVVIYFAKDNDLKKKVQEREDVFGQSYPEFVSKFVLLYGTGLSVRHIFERLKEDDSLHPFCKQEISILCNDLQNGMLENAAIDKFTKRCQCSLYVKFGALLVQNSQKGNKKLIELLEAETQNTFLLRKQQARKLGEEAGTKLLLPMMLMLLIVMVLLIVPAFLSFS